MKLQKEKTRPSAICKEKFVFFFNNPKDVNLDEIKDVNISGEMTFHSVVVKDHFKITFNIKNAVVESVKEKKYIDIVLRIWNQSHTTARVPIEQLYR